MSSSNVISQKEYLKKYLGVGKAPGEKKKKRKKDKNVTNRLKIIDDDIDEYNISKEIQDDIEAADEDAPQIVAVIDDRPPALRVDEKTNSLMWQPIGEDNEIKQEVPLKVSSFQLRKSTSESQHIISSKSISNINLKIKSERIDNVNKKPGDSSSRINKQKYDTGKHDGKGKCSIPSDKTIKTELSDNDMSPARANDKSYIKTHLSKEANDLSPPQSPQMIKKEQSDSDVSPPRRVQHRRNSDLSPPRMKKKNHDSDISPLRRGRNKSDEDISPPRKNRENARSSPIKYMKKKYSDSDSDISPPRKNLSQAVKRESHSNSDRTKRNKYHSRSNNSPSKRSNTSSPSRRVREPPDISPPRKHQRKNSPSKGNEDISPPRKTKRQQSNSPDRKRRNHNSRWGSWSPDHNEGGTSSKKPEKTMSGKRAGLQSAKELSKELAALRQKEDQVFQNMPEEVSGRNATTVLRGQKSIDPEEEARKLKKEKEMKEKYDRWGKGLKQVESDSQKMAEQLYEMSKPLARYADDEDLEKYLKEQEREGDPMLAYIRKKKKKKNVEAGIPEKPMYMGDFMPNRFGIKPGYRWDGVDRSNGYEKRWFEKYNARKAVQEDAFKWSTEDM